MPIPSAGWWRRGSDRLRKVGTAAAFRGGSVATDAASRSAYCRRRWLRLARHRIWRSSLGGGLSKEERHTDQAEPEGTHGASSLLQEEIPHEHRVDARRIEAAHGVARRADQRLAEEIERGVVEHRQSGGFAGGVQQLPVQRIISSRSTVCTRTRSSARMARGELLAMLRAHAAHGGQIARVGAARRNTRAASSAGTEAANLRNGSRCLMKMFRFSVE